MLTYDLQTYLVANEAINTWQRRNPLTEKKLTSENLSIVHLKTLKTTTCPAVTSFKHMVQQLQHPSDEPKDFSVFLQQVGYFTVQGYSLFTSTPHISRTTTIPHKQLRNACCIITYSRFLSKQCFNLRTQVFKNSSEFWSDLATTIPSSLQIHIWQANNKWWKEFMKKWSACILIRDNLVTKPADIIKENKQAFTLTRPEKSVYAWKRNCFHITASTVVTMKKG